MSAFLNYFFLYTKLSFYKEEFNNMPITNNIGGVNKDSTPKININGTYKGINTGKVNIDGVYKQFYPKEVYTIKIYRNGSLYSTLSCEKGDSIILPSYGIGYATSSSSTTTTYGTKETITPSSNLNLYIVYQYGFNFYRYGKLYDTQVEFSQALNCTLKVKSVSGVSNIHAFSGYSQSTSSNTIFVTTNTSVKCSSMTNLYAVYTFKLNLYKYGSLLNTLSATSQSSSNSFTLPGCAVDSDDTSFYGWTTTSGSTSKQYSQGDSVSVGVTSDMNLYAIFEYVKSANYSYGTLSSGTTNTNNTNQSVTLPMSGTVTITGGCRRSTSGHSGGVPTGSGDSLGSFTTGTTNGSVPYIKINGSYKSITLKYSYSDGPAQSYTENMVAGTKIDICGTYTSYSSGTGYNGSTTVNTKEIIVQYPTSIYNKVMGYRSTK